MEVENSDEQPNSNPSSPILSTRNPIDSNQTIEIHNEQLSEITNVESNSQPLTLISNTLSQTSVSTVLEHEDSDLCDSPSKKRRLSDIHEEDDDEGQTCPICLDNWTTSGDHRLCSLKCGHLFGYSCIKRWFNLESKKCCPSCKKKVYINDMRYIYARKVIAMDTVELTIMKQKLERTVEEKNRVQLELSKAICKVYSLTEEVEEYKKKLDVLKSIKHVQNQTHQLPTQQSSENVHLYKEKTIDLGKNSNCRVFDCKTATDAIAVSVKSSNNLYSGFGVKMINMTTYKPTAFIPVHSQTIRDIKYHETEPWLLTCSVDKKIKILDINTNNTSITFESTSPLWSCCWGTDNGRILYVGQQQGSVSKFDMRQPSEPVRTMSIQGDFSPVVSVQAVKPSCSLFPFGGIISCKLNSVWMFETTTDEPNRYLLPLEGPFVSMTYQKNNDHLFLSSRPNSKYPYIRHILCGLQKQDGGVNCYTVHTFRGGNTQKMLTRTCLFSNKNNYAAAYIEDQHIVSLWNINTGNKVGSIPAHESVLDLNSVRTSYADFLLSLTESKLEFFKFTS